MEGRQKEDSSVWLWKKESAVVAALRGIEEGDATESKRNGGSWEHEQKEELKPPDAAKTPPEPPELFPPPGMNRGEVLEGGENNEILKKKEEKKPSGDIGDLLEAHLASLKYPAADDSVDGLSVQWDDGDRITVGSEVSSWLSRPQSVGGRSGASGRALKFARKQREDKEQALPPVEKRLHRAKTAGGFTPLAGLVEEAVEEALGGGAGPSDTFRDNFDGNGRLFRGIWETTYLIVVGSILWALWAYEGSSPSVPDVITVVVSAAGSLGIVARAFSARGYIGVIYRGHVGSGIVDLHLVSAGNLDAFFSRWGVCRSWSSGRAVRDAVAFVILSPLVLGLVLSSMTKVVHFVFHLVVGTENNGSWELGTGVLRYRDRVVVLPFMEKRTLGIYRGRTSRIRWPGGASRSYYGDSVKGSWALHFASRDSFLAELGCEKVFLQFGTERRLICEAGSRVLSFVIAMRDTRGGLLLIPVDTAGGVRVQVRALAFSGAAAGVTILMGVECPEREPYPEDKVAETLHLQGAPFCLDVSACGIGAHKTADSQANMFCVLDGAGAGAVTDVCPLWKCLDDMCFDSLAAAWAAGYFGGHFLSLDEYCSNDEVRKHVGQGKGRRCVVSTPPREAPGVDYDVVLGVRAHRRGILKIPVDLPGELSFLPRRYRFVQPTGISGKYCLIPAGINAKWEYALGGVAEHLENCEECLVA
ncbi:unnamed protein product [Pylaiella littoralis]